MIFRCRAGEVSSLIQNLQPGASELKDISTRMIALEVSLAELRVELKARPSFRQVLIFLGSTATIGIAAFTLYELIIRS